MWTNVLPWYTSAHEVREAAYKKWLPKACVGLTFKEVGLQPEFEAYELTVTPPGVASECEAVQMGQGIQ